ncbi:sirohydrochlorin chelatase [Nonomuraea roseoviolacea subsp. roseoviolacea]|uniref:Sirohydrochlorin ferrochelatase n=1 Tax=Nonomuraea roseoviolacea subsp. carminata TaxID=160689 RepID=A0ABT1K7J5_9ACTN|nr:sirohydrochlorin chelatase [Nonomuraea roseoviolacea]MCP2349973.1 sirohydrochlorin ferrochelatase [Nonomuraea roseoviolacea subsp. carminata]
MWPAPLADGAGPRPPLVAVAHGSRDPRAAAVVEALLDEVRRARPGLPVRSAYLDHAAPSLGQALAGLGEAVVLPLLLTEAYHSRVDLPSALNEVRAREPRLRVRYGATLGPHPLLVGALERRLAEAGVAPRDRGTAVVLVSAGSSDARANAVVARVAGEWALSGGWWGVVPAYASAATPTPEEAVRLLREAGAPRVAVAPYLLAPGLFADKVRRATLAAGADVVADVLGPAPEIARVLLERYDAALRAPAEAAAS